MPIAFSCASCSAKITAPDAAAGRIAPCPKCKVPVSVPTPAQPSQEELEARAAELLNTFEEPAELESRAAALLTEGDTAAPPTIARGITSAARVEDPTLGTTSPVRAPSGPDHGTPQSGSPKRIPLIVGIAFLLLCATGIAVYTVHENERAAAQRAVETAANRARSEQTAQQLAEAERKQQQAADEQARLAKQKAELTARERALAEERDRLDKKASKDHLRNAALRAKAERLLALGKRLDELRMTDAANRLVVAVYDKDCLSKMAEAGLTRSDKERPAVALYLQGREKLTTAFQGTAETALTTIEGTLRIELVADCPAEIQDDFRTAGEQLLASCKAALLAPYDVPDKDIDEYARVAQEVNADKRTEQKRRSKEAQEAGVIYLLTLKGTERGIAIAATERLKGIHSAYVKGEVSEEFVLKIERWYQTNTRPVTANTKIWDEANYLSKLLGDWVPEVEGKPGHDTTIAQAWKSYRTVVIKLELEGKLK